MVYFEVFVDIMCGYSVGYTMLLEGFAIPILKLWLLELLGSPRLIEFPWLKNVKPIHKRYYKDNAQFQKLLLTPIRHFPGIQITFPKLDVHSSNSFSPIYQVSSFVHFSQNPPLPLFLDNL